MYIEPLSKFFNNNETEDLNLKYQTDVYKQVYNLKVIIQ